MDSITFAYNNKPMPKSRTTQKHFQTFNQHKKNCVQCPLVAIDSMKVFFSCFFLLSIHRFDLIELLITRNNGEYNLYVQCPSIYILDMNTYLWMDGLYEYVCLHKITIMSNVQQTN